MRIDPITFGEFSLGKPQQIVNNGEIQFSSILADTITQTNTTDAANEAGNINLVIGADNSLHDTMIEASKAEMAVNMTVQIRNRLVDAYNEISRMQI